MPKRSFDSKVVFVTTSPRTPAKMIPEIALLNAHFNSKSWNNETQKAFMEILRDENFFNGEGKNDPSFSARDRINRAPQALGFVELKPSIQLTPAGIALTTSRRTEEIFLRQLLKFQIPSPYHKPSTKAANFWVKPYLEIFRLVRHFGTLTFDELKIFALQLTDYHNFDSIINKIENFRVEKAKNKGKYKMFMNKCLENELREVYANDLLTGNISLRERKSSTEQDFIKNKRAKST